MNIIRVPTCVFRAVILSVSGQFGLLSPTLESTLCEAHVGLELAAAFGIVLVPAVCIGMDDEIAGRGPVRQVSASGENDDGGEAANTAGDSDDQIPKCIRVAEALRRFWNLLWRP